MYKEIYTTATKLSTFDDGRLPIEQLLARLNTLVDHGWKRHVLFNQIAIEPGHNKRTYLPICAYTSPNPGLALWQIIGVHGEEPAGVMAVAKHLDVLISMARGGVPIVLLGPCNPKGYYTDWRYPEVWRNMEWGRSTTEAGHLLPHLDEPWRARYAEAATPEAWAINNFVLDQIRKYPPLWVVNYHEDEADIFRLTFPRKDRFSTYLYSLSRQEDSIGDPISKAVAAIWRAVGVSLIWDGETRSGEPIFDGVARADPDDSIDELLASGVQPAAYSVLVTETPTIGENGPIPVWKRVAIQNQVVLALPKLWKLAQDTYL